MGLANNLEFDTRNPGKNQNILLGVAAKRTLFMPSLAISILILNTIKNILSFPALKNFIPKGNKFTV